MFTFSVFFLYNKHTEKDTGKVCPSGFLSMALVLLVPRARPRTAAAPAVHYPIIVINCVPLVVRLLQLPLLITPEALWLSSVSVCTVSVQ